MKKNKLYEEFEILAEKLGLKILNGKGSFDGGICIVNEKKVIVLNKTKPIEQRLRVLANIFLEFNLEKIYLVPALRAYIEEFRALELN